MSDISMEDEPTISLAAAADRLSTNCNVIRRWIDEKRIPAIYDSNGIPRIQQKQFELILQELSDWLREFDPADEEGYSRASVKALEQFWKVRYRP